MKEEFVTTSWGTAPSPGGTGKWDPAGSNG